jgi:hypothetical protein
MENYNRLSSKSHFHLEVVFFAIKLRGAKAMKKILGYFTTVFLVGCIATNNTVEVNLAVSGTLVMDFGKYKIKMDRQFKYIGEISDEVVLNDIQESKKPRFHIKAYIFIDPLDDVNNLKKIVMVIDTQLPHPEDHYNGEIDYAKSKLNNIVRAGYTDLGDARVAYSVQRINEYSIETAMLAKIATEKGYQMNADGKNAAYIRYGKVIGSNRMLQVHYIETGNDDVIKFYSESKSQVRFEK